jgi:glycosyltransferase involved in cell wall biosynthesis
MNMWNNKRRTCIIPLEDRGPLRVLFLLTSMPVGGAETLLKNLIERIDRDRFVPELCCLKELGPLGEELARAISTAHGLIRHKFDLRVVPRLVDLLTRQRVDALVTVGCGDKMFWGRIAARWARTPVVMSALHSTGWPDGVGVLNRWLTRWTDCFIAVASEHGRHLIEGERFPAEKVHVIPNGVDTDKFRRDEAGRRLARRELSIPTEAPVCGIVAALRPEKNHALFLESAKLVLDERPDARFVIVGDGPERPALELRARSLSIESAVHFLGTRRDTVQVLSALDVFCLTSHNEANPVSILEALSVGLPVVATQVGSVPLTVQPGITGFLANPGAADEISAHIQRLFGDRTMRTSLGNQGRDLVIREWSLQRMVTGYESLIEAVYRQKSHRQAAHRSELAEKTCQTAEKT